MSVMVVFWWVTERNGSKYGKKNGTPSGGSDFTKHVPTVSFAGAFTRHQQFCRTL
jgi:hypothetical protein